jgi:hypothetical protein
MNLQPPSLRHRARQNLLTAALNVAIERGLISERKTTFEFELDGLPIIACVTADPDEIGVWVIAQPTEFGRRFACALITGYRRALIGAATACGWLDLGSGRFLDISGGFHASNAITPVLAGLAVAPNKRRSRT